MIGSGGAIAAPGRKDHSGPCLVSDGARPLTGRESRPKHTAETPKGCPKSLTRRKMILTQCAVCATDLGLSSGKKCGRCSTRYCGAECQKQHWERGGHDNLCKKIKKAGGAEQYNANMKYTEAVSVAVEKCADLSLIHI